MTDLNSENDTRTRNANAGHRLDELLRIAMREHDGQIALVIGDASITYSDLHARCERLASELVARGATSGTFVAVTVDRSLDAIVGILGVVLSGAAYVPIDAAGPRSRLRQILGQAGISIVTGSECREVAAAFGLTEVPIPVCEEPPRRAAPTGSSPDDAVYVIFTSGSTGTPKGVIVSHAAVVNSTNARFAVFPSRPMIYLMLAPLTFNAAVAGLYFSLAAGGTLVLPTEDEARDPGLLGGLVTRHAVTHLDSVPSQYAALLALEAPALRSLTCVIVAGEVLSQGLVRRHGAALPDTALFNEYGATETTVWSTVHRCDPRDAGPLAPIGVAVDGVEVTVLNDDLEPVDPGQIGEIAVSGRQLAQGYLGQPALTAERFVVQPRRPGQRMYLTGDLGRFDDGGRLVHCGRIGSMVKVRGFRVEIDEVEAHLRAQPDIVDAVVVPQRFADTTRLVAVIVKSVRGPSGQAELRDRLAQHLPSYMIPSVWREIDRMPVTVNGKIDRDAAARLVNGCGPESGTLR